jgi:hypothetical protein
MLKGEAGALNTEHMKLLGEVEQIVERKRALMKRFAEYTEPYTHLFDHLTANDWARVTLLTDAARYGAFASKGVQGVFRDHERRRKKKAAKARAAPYSARRIRIISCVRISAEVSREGTSKLG